MDYLYSTRMLQEFFEGFICNKMDNARNVEKCKHRMLQESAEFANVIHVCANNLCACNPLNKSCSLLRDSNEAELKELINNN